MSYYGAESGNRTRMRKDLILPLLPVVARDWGFVGCCKNHLCVFLCVFSHI